MHKWPPMRRSLSQASWPFSWYAHTENDCVCPALWHEQISQLSTERGLSGGLQHNPRPCLAALRAKGIKMLIYLISIHWLIVEILQAKCSYNFINTIQERNEIRKLQGFPGGPVVESLPANAGDTGLIPAPERSHMLWCKWACAPQLLNPH